PIARRERRPRARPWAPSVERDLRSVHARRPPGRVVAGGGGAARLRARLALHEASVRPPTGPGPGGHGRRMAGDRGVGAPGAGAPRPRAPRARHARACAGGPTRGAAGAGRTVCRGPALRSPRGTLLLAGAALDAG